MDVGIGDSMKDVSANLPSEDAPLASLVSAFVPFEPTWEACLQAKQLNENPAFSRRSIRQRHQ